MLFLVVSKHCVPKNTQVIACGCALKQKVVMDVIAAAGLKHKWKSALSETEFKHLTSLFLENESTKHAVAGRSTQFSSSSTAPKGFRFVIPRVAEGEGPPRDIVCQDVKQWLADHGDYLPEGMSVISSMPDVTETPYELPEWKEWFVDIAAVRRAVICHLTTPTVIF